MCETQNNIVREKPDVSLERSEMIVLSFGRGRNHIYMFIPFDAYYNLT